jgi:hypothetical protein
MIHDPVLLAFLGASRRLKQKRQFDRRAVELPLSEKPFNTK